MPSHSHITATVACLLLPLAGSVTGQAPSQWADLHISSGVNPFMLTGTEKFLAYRDGSFMRVYSAASGKWVPFLLSSGTTPVYAHDMALVPEGDRWSAYSAWTGTVEHVLLDYANSTLIKHNVRPSVAAVLEGSMLHTYSAFTGHWVTRALPTGWDVAVDKRIVAIGDTTGATCSGAAAFDAWTGQWHELPAQPAAVQGGLGVAGSAVTIDFGSYQHGWSAQHPDWVMQAVPATNFASVLTHYDNELVVNNSTVFSGPTGEFHTWPLAASPSTAPHATGLIAFAWGGTTPYVAGATGNGWTALPTGAVRFGAVNHATLVALFSAGSDTYAYSGATGTLAPINLPYLGTAYARIQGATAWMRHWPTAEVVLFSALTGQWHTAPVQIFSAKASSCGAICITATGVLGFSSYHGTFTPLSITGYTVLSTVHGPGVLAVTDQNGLHVFDPRTEKWQFAALDMALAEESMRDTTMLMSDGTTTVAFSERSGRLESLTVTEPILSFSAAGDIGSVRTANHLYAFSGLPDSLPWAEVPSETTAVSIGAVSRHQVRLPQNHIGVLGLGTRTAAAIPLALFGELWLDPASMATVLLTPEPGQERAVVTVVVPSAASLRGTEWWLQSLILPPSALPYLTDPGVFRVL